MTPEQHRAEIVTLTANAHVAQRATQAAWTAYCNAGGVYGPNRVELWDQYEAAQVAWFAAGDLLTRAEMAYEASKRGAA